MPGQGRLARWVSVQGRGVLRPAFQLRGVAARDGHGVPGWHGVVDRNEPLRQRGVGEVGDDHRNLHGHPVAQIQRGISLGHRVQGHCIRERCGQGVDIAAGGCRELIRVLADLVPPRPRALESAHIGVLELVPVGEVALRVQHPRVRDPDHVGPRRADVGRSPHGIHLQRPVGAVQLVVDLALWGIGGAGGGNGLQGHRQHGQSDQGDDQHATPTVAAQLPPGQPGGDQPGGAVSGAHRGSPLRDTTAPSRR